MTLVQIFGKSPTNKPFILIQADLLIFLLIL